PVAAKACGVLSAVFRNPGPGRKGMKGLTSTSASTEYLALSFVRDPGRTGAVNLPYRDFSKESSPGTRGGCPHLRNLVLFLTEPSCTQATAIVVAAMRMKSSPVAAR